MRKPFKIFFYAIVLFLQSNFLIAQNQEHKFVFSATLSSSAIGFIFNQANGITKNISTFSHPAIQASMDYCLYKNWLSVGLISSYQKMGFAITNYEIITGTDTINSNVGADLTRFNIGARVLAHYGNKKRIDMYSGLRLGYQRNAINTSTDGILYDILSKYPDISSVMKFLKIGPDLFWNPIVQNKFGYQVILFGLRAYVSAHIGLTAELAVGRPDFISYGIQYRF